MAEWLPGAGLWLLGGTGRFGFALHQPGSPVPLAQLF